MVGWDIFYTDKTSCQWFHVQHSFTAVEGNIQEKYCGGFQCVASKIVCILWYLVEATISISIKHLTGVN